MGARGPLPQSPELRLLKGNPGHRKTAPAPQAVRAIPDPPTWLDREARAEWRRVTPELHRLGLLAQLDRAVLALYCSWWARWREADKILERDGLIIAGHRGAKTKHPAWQLSRDAAGMVASLAKELGLAPASRLRMRAPERELPDDDLLD